MYLSFHVWFLVVITDVWVIPNLLQISHTFYKILPDSNIIVWTVNSSNFSLIYSWFYYVSRSWPNICIYQTPPTQTGYNTKFSFSQTSCQTKAKEPSLPQDFSITGVGREGLVPFPRLLARREMRKAFSWFRARFPDFLSWNNNRYSKCSTNV